MKSTKIKDYYGNYHSIPVSDEIYHELLKMRTEGCRISRAERRHRSHLTLEEAVLMHLEASTPYTIEEILIADEEEQALLKAIARLTPIQRRRVQYLLDDLTMRDIAEKEHCHYNSVKESVTAAMKKIQWYLQSCSECNPSKYIKQK